MPYWRRLGLRAQRAAVGLGFAASLAALAIPANSAWATNAAAVAPPRPTVHAPRLNEGEAPVIDGDISDAAWAKAAVLDTFFQEEPNYGDPPSERTVVRVAYDANNLYVSVYAYDREPTRIIATQKIRDGRLINDDRVKIFLDPNKAGRDAYSFEVNALGGYTDALLQNNQDFFTNWNIIWYVKGRRVADGWTAEMAIPFRSL